MGELKCLEGNSYLSASPIALLLLFRCSVTGAAVVGPGSGLPARVGRRALRRACGSPVRSSPELRPGLDSARTPQSPAPVGYRAVSAWAWRERTWQAGVGSHARVACPGPGVEEGAGKSEELGLRSWKFPFACLHSGPRGGISRPCCVARNWGVSAAFEESRVGLFPQNPQVNR